MTGISKNFYKFSSLMAVVALFLGLMVTGCSEGDDVPAVVDYDANGTKLDVIVGISGDAAAEDEAAEKGLDVPANVFNMVVSLIAGDKVAIEKSFVAQGSEWVGASFWRELGEGRVLMSSNISEEEVIGADLTSISDVTAVAVMVYDKDENCIGALCKDDVTLVKGSKNTIDFSAADAPAFVDALTLAENTTLELTTDPEAEEDVVTISVGDTVTVNGTVSIALSDATTISEDVDGEDIMLTLAEDTAALTIDKNVITGALATDHAVEVIASYALDEDNELTSSINVMVEGSETETESESVETETETETESESVETETETETESESVETETETETLRPSR